MSREEFTESWLTESPMRISGNDLYPVLVHNIRELQGLNHPAYVTVDLVDSLKKINLTNSVYYWFERNGKIQLAGDFEKAPQCLKVRGVGKDKNISGPPYASELYVAVLRDQNSSLNSILLKSDDLMTNKGLDIWKQLISNGHSVSVYNKSNPGQSHTRLSSIVDLEMFHSGSVDYKQYNYILSENSNNGIEVRAQFAARRMRELSGML